MAFTIEQIINLSNTGFTAEQIKAFEQSQIQQTPVQQVQQVPVQQTPVQQAPVQQVPVQQTQVQQVPVQQVPVQQTPVQQVPVNTDAPFSDASAKAMLDFIKSIQSSNLAQATGQQTKQENAYEAGLDILGKGGNK